MLEAPSPTALCQKFCSLLTWAVFLDAVRDWKGLGLGTTGSHLYCLQMMMFCRLHQCALERFAAECEAAGMKIKVMVLDPKKVTCPLRLGGVSLSQVELFKYVGVFFRREGRMEREIETDLFKHGRSRFPKYNSRTL